MKTIHKLALSIDTLSPSFELRYNKRTKHTSLIGSACTALLAVLIAGLAMFLGRDIFLRSNPITRINKVAAPESRIHLKDTVLPIFFMVNWQPNPSKFTEEFDILTVLRYVDMNSEVVVQDYYLQLIDCKEEDFVGFASLREEIGDSFSAARCIDTETVRDKEGRHVDIDVAINGTMASHKSFFVELFAIRKAGRTADLTSIYTISVGIPNIFVDNSNYESPTIIEGVSFDGEIDSSLRKRIIITLTKDAVSSDTGLLFSSVEREDFISYHSRRTEYSLIKPGDSNYLSIILTSLDNHSVFEREYIKLPAVVAEVSGIGKVIFWIFKLFMGEISFYLFYLENADFKVKSNIQFDNSTESVSQNKVFEPIKPSFLTFLFTKTLKFNLKYPKKDTILNKFDIRTVNQSISRLEESYSTNQRVEFRQHLQ